VQADAQKNGIQATLDELEELHRVEALALRRLSRDTIDELTDRKLALWETLRALSSQTPPGPEHRPQLERIRRAALSNQILLHHARDAVRTILQTASGQQPPTAPSNRASAAIGGLRVDFRG
jgi:flagellar biosynthesis/type III secretory pathway chaperone